MKRIGLQFFADENDTGATETVADDNATPGGGAETKPLNYEELFKTDKSLQSFLDSKITKATTTAIETYKTKEKIKADATLSESEKLKGMTDSEKVEYFKTKAESLEKNQLKMQEAESLKTQTLEIFKEKKIPTELAEHLFDFTNITAEGIKTRTDKLGEYEFYKTGEFESELERRLNEKLKQKSPTTTIGGKVDDGLLKAFGLL